ncbi:restriction endonuclease subunit S [Clostridium sp. JS66]|nr:restriction endonuclease subunit S [Clostridium sp. JS66]
MKTKEFVEGGKSTYTGTAGQQRVKKEFVENYVIAIPPIPEQKRMVAKVDELFSLIDELDNNKQDLLQNIADSKNKILQLAIQGKLAEQNEEDEPASVLLDKIAEEKERLIKEKKIKKEKSLPEIKEEEKYFELSKGWEWCRFGNIGCFQKGYAFKSKDYVGDGVKITKVSNLNNPFNKDVVYIDKKDALKYEQYKLYKDDIVLTTVGSWPTAPASVVGNVIYIDEIFDNTLLNQNAVRIRSKLNQKYLNIILKSKLFKRYIVDIAQGTANQASITQEDIKLFLLPIPPIAEQFRIVEKVNMLMAYLDELEKTILGQDVI